MPGSVLGLGKTTRCSVRRPSEHVVAAIFSAPIHECLTEAITPFNEPHARRPGRRAHHNTTNGRIRDGRKDIAPPCGAIGRQQ